MTGIYAINHGLEKYTLVHANGRRDFRKRRNQRSAKMSTLQLYVHSKQYNLELSIMVHGSVHSNKQPSINNMLTVTHEPKS